MRNKNKEFDCFGGFLVDDIITCLSIKDRKLHG